MPTSAHRFIERQVIGPASVFDAAAAYVLGFGMQRAPASRSPPRPLAQRKASS
jgi:hypothetical protein